jgi:hypothetical protein
MADELRASGARDQRLHEAFVAYLEAAAAGRAPDRQELLARHPDLAAELTAFFAHHGKFRVLAEPTSPSIGRKHHRAARRRSCHQAERPAADLRGL